MYPKITLLTENVYIIRSTSTFLDGIVRVEYYMTPTVWTRAPTRATLFMDYECAEAHLNMYAKRDKPKKGWADGRTEVLDVVPLYGEIFTSPNSTVVNVSRANDEGSGDGSE